MQTDYDALCARLRELLEKATPGPWCGYSEYEVNLPYSLFSGTPMDTGFCPIEPLCPVDIDFIAEARNNLPALLDAITTLREELREARESADRLAEALENSTTAMEAVLVGMDKYNQENGTHLGGAPFFRCGSQVATNRTALMQHRSKP